MTGWKKETVFIHSTHISQEIMLGTGALHASLLGHYCLKTFECLLINLRIKSKLVELVLEASGIWLAVI
jgi:hypothetical protein